MIDAYEDLSVRVFSRTALKMILQPWGAARFGKIEQSARVLPAMNGDGNELPHSCLGILPAYVSFRPFGCSIGAKMRALDVAFLSGNGRVAYIGLGRNWHVRERAG